MITSSDTRNAYVLFALRLLVALVFLWHGVPKAFNIEMAMAKFEGFGLPGILGPVIGWLEVVAGGLLLVGLWTQWMSLLLAAIMVGALVTVQIPGGVTAGLERDLLMLVGLIVLVVQGPGAWSIHRPTLSSAFASG